MGAPNADNVSNSAPTLAGVAFSAPLGTEPPSTAGEELDSAYRGYGYISEDGLANEFEADSEQIPAFGGDEVLSIQTSYAETFTLAFLEESLETKQAFFGEDNVYITEEGFAAVHTSEDLPYLTWVWDIRLTGGRKKRIVIFEAKVDEREGVEHVTGGANTHGVTLRARGTTQELNGETKTGVTAIEYIIDASVANGGGSGN